MSKNVITIQDAEKLLEFCKTSEFYYKFDYLISEHLRIAKLNNNNPTICTLFLQLKIEQAIQDAKAFKSLNLFRLSQIKFYESMQTLLNELQKEYVK